MHGFVISVLDTGSTWKKSQLLSQLRAHSSAQWYWFRLGSKQDWYIMASSWSVQFQQLCEYKVQFGHCLVPRQYAWQPQARPVGCESAQQLQVSPRRKVKSPYDRAHSRARECWVRIENNCWVLERTISRVNTVLERTISCVNTRCNASVVYVPVIGNIWIWPTTDITKDEAPYKAVIGDSSKMSDTGKSSSTRTIYGPLAGPVRVRLESHVLSLLKW